MNQLDLICYIYMQKVTVNKILQIVDISKTLTSSKVYNRVSREHYGQ